MKTVQVLQRFVSALHERARCRLRPSERQPRLEWDCPRAPLLPIEAGFMAAGIVLIAVYGWSRADAAIGSAIDIASFEQHAPDTRLWSDSRVRQYRATAALPQRGVVGLLRIRGLELRVPLYVDTSEVHLNRGVGLIPAMSRPGEGGNLGIAGHRDGFFRALKDIEPGASIEVLTRQHAYRYRVTGVTIVEKFDTRLLQRTQDATITLVTCYPFYLVGKAPRRFIVRGELTSIETSDLDHRHRSSTSRRGA